MTIKLCSLMLVILAELGLCLSSAWPVHAQSHDHTHSSGEPSEQDEADASVDATSSGARSAMNILYVELLGNAIGYSLNYERFVSEAFTLRVGGEVLPTTSGTLVTAPVMANYLGVGAGSHKLDLGLGVLLMYKTQNNLPSEGIATGDVVSIGFAGTATIGYRYVPTDGGFHFKVGFTPVFGGQFLPWPGISFGAVF